VIWLQWTGHKTIVRVKMTEEIKLYDIMLDKFNNPTYLIVYIFGDKDSALCNDFSGLIGDCTCEAVVRKNSDYAIVFNIERISENNDYIARLDLIRVPDHKGKLHKSAYNEWALGSFLLESLGDLSETEKIVSEYKDAGDWGSIWLEVARLNNVYGSSEKFRQMERCLDSLDKYFVEKNRLSQTAYDDHPKFDYLECYLFEKDDSIKEILEFRSEVLSNPRLITGAVKPPLDVALAFMEALSFALDIVKKRDSGLWSRFILDYKRFGSRGHRGYLERKSDDIHEQLKCLSSLYDEFEEWVSGGCPGRGE